MYPAFIGLLCCVLCGSTSQSHAARHSHSVTIMGVTTQYLRFVAGPSFGAVSNADGRAIFVRIKSSKHRYVAVTVCEDVILWDLKTKEKLTVCKGIWCLN